MAVCLSGLPGLPAFDAVGEPATLAQRWLTWKEEFELYVTASGISDPTQKRALLLHLAGPKVRDVFNNSIPATTRGEAKDYKKAMDCLSEHFKLKKNAPMARQIFLAATPLPGETVNNFITRLQKLAEHCDYEGERDNQVRDRAISFLKDKNLKSKLYHEETLPLSKLMEIVSQYHDKEALILIPESHVNSLSRDPKQGGKCWRCDKVGHFAKECRRSRDHKCGKCGHIGHFEVCCHSKQNKGRDPSQSSSRGRGNPRTKPSRGRRGGNSKEQRDVHSVCEDASADERVNSDDFYVFSTGSTDGENTMELMIEDKLVNIVIDSGASCNLMSEEMFNFVSGGKARLLDCNKRVYAYASVQPLQLKGKYFFNVQVPQTHKSLYTEFYVMCGKAATLLGREASELLGVLRVGVSINSCDVKSDSMESLTNSLDRKALLKSKFPKVFQGLGKLKGYQLKLHIDESVQPVAQPLRRIPFSRRAKVTEKLEELLKLDVIEKVEGPTSWVNPLVVVEKPNGDIRICLDMRQANQAIVREKHPVPTVEETLQEVSYAKVFSKLDLNMAFHQIELHPDSRDITTFAAPDGLYRYKRLLFGVNMATEKFQQIVWQVIKCCPGAYNLHDDLRVVGADDKEHDENLDRVMRKLEESNLTLNYDKCEIGVSSMVYMGDVLSGEGLKVSSERVEAIVKAPTPQNQSEVRSFLGSVQFCAKFIPNFATISSPLWDLTGKHVKWRWGPKEKKAFQEIKGLLTRAPVMAYHRQGATTRLTTDASPVGVGAVLEQKQRDGTYRPIYYASRKLSNVETRYSQFEREALAVRWACEKFYLYLYGIKFEVRTDHKPLVTVLGTKSKPPSARIERWLLYLQQFQYTLTHIPGKDNPADVLSRLPIGSTQDDDTRKTEDFAYSVASAAIPAALLPKQVETATANDPTLRIVHKAVMTGDWTQLSGTTYKAVKEELWVVGQVVMRGTRIVMPQSLWKQTIMLAHEGHQGMVRTKARLREKVWWPQMDKQVEDAIRSCHPCQLVGPRSKPEPVRSSSLPDGPWQEISVDLLEISNGEHLLVAVDYYSRWLEAILLKKTDARHVIKSMEAIFRTHGLPETLRSDNGPPFASKEFEGFLEYLGIDHKKGIPYWPQSNGEVERANETILKIVRIARVEGKDWKKALENFLFQYRVTPHTVTGLSPAELLMGRKLRDKLPRVEFSKDRATEAYWQQLLRERDTRAKLSQKEYADRTRGAKHSNIEEGDKVLLKQTRENKLSPNYEPEPYIVTRKDGNAVILQDTNGNNKMRNIAHTKKFMDPGTVKKAEIDPQPCLAEQPAQPRQDQPNLSSSQSATDTSEAVSSPLPSVASRPVRAKRAPSWMQDYDVVTLQFKGHKLDKKDFFGKSDPFLVFYRCNEDNSYTAVHRTEVIKNTLNPTWKPFTIHARALCNGDYDRSIRVECYDWDRDGGHDLIGIFSTTINELNRTPGLSFECMNPKKQAKKKGYKNSGTISLMQCKLEQQPSFLDYIRGGTQISFTVAIDFTASNGDPRNANSLHYINPYEQNQYVKALTAVGRICQDYDTDKLFPAFGFGARLPPTWQVSHEFPLNGNPQNPMCEGIDGVLASYYHSIQRVQLYGPTNFAPIINQITRIASAAQRESPGNEYFVLLMLTDGIISDMAQTKEAIVNAASLPISIIIVGVGAAEFDAMEELDGDTVRLSSRGRTAERDIVQFVPFRDYIGQAGHVISGARLAKDVLEELPDQFIEYMKKRHYRPRPPQYNISTLTGV